MAANPDVDRFMKKLDHPLKAELEALRKIFLDASGEVTEVIKWSCPTFVYKGNIASLVVRTKKQAQVMFHQGALLENKKGLLVGDGQTVRHANFANMADVKKNQKALTHIISHWIKLQDGK